MKPPYTCKFCGSPSWLDPYDQTMPPAYCHESDHGEPDEYEDTLSQPSTHGSPLALPMVLAMVVALIAVLLLPGASHAGGRFINHHWYDGNSSYRSHSGRTVIHQNQTFNRNLRSYLKPSYVIQDGVVYGTIPGTDVPSVMRRPIGDQ